MGGPCPALAKFCRSRRRNVKKCKKRPALPCFLDDLWKKGGPFAEAPGCRDRLVTRKGGKCVIPAEEDRCSKAYLKRRCKRRPVKNECDRQESSASSKSKRSQKSVWGRVKKVLAWGGRKKPNGSGKGNMVCCK